MYIKYICKRKCQVLLSFIYFSPILRQMCLWKRGDIIHERCRNSHFRALIIHNFLRPPTTVLNIFLYHISPHASSPSPPPPLAPLPTFQMVMPCLKSVLLWFLKKAQWKKICIFVLTSPLQEQSGFRVSWKLCLNLYSSKWL